jgi:hypothetical protein
MQKFQRRAAKESIVRILCVSAFCIDLPLKKDGFADLVLEGDGQLGGEAERV